MPTGYPDVTQSDGMWDTQSHQPSSQRVEAMVRSGMEKLSCRNWLAHLKTKGSSASLQPTSSTHSEQAQPHQGLSVCSDLLFSALPVFLL